jgi:hypothetical protein
MLSCTGGSSQQHLTCTARWLCTLLAFVCASKQTDLTGRHTACRERTYA